jgi:hypothetical protein
MRLPGDVQEQIEETLRNFCDKRVPEHARNEIRLSFSVRGNSVLLSEERQRWNNPSEWLTMRIAQFRFDPETSKWSLHCRDRNERWHGYKVIRPTKDFSVLLEEVDRDPTGIFWG